jgi:hypothetical protein
VVFVVLTVVVGDGDGVFVAVCAKATEPAAITDKAKTPTATAAFFIIVSPPSTKNEVITSLTIRRIRGKQMKNL